MKLDVLALVAKREELSVNAQALRVKVILDPDDMMTLAKILSKQAQLEMQLAGLGIHITPVDSESKTNDESYPF